MMPPVRFPPYREHKAYPITNTKRLAIFTEVPVYCESRTKLKHTVWVKNAMLLNIKTDGFCNCHYALKGLMIRWIKIDQLDVTCFIISLFNAQHVSNVSTFILRSLRLICWVVRNPDTTPPQPNHSVTPTHIEPEQYNPWNNSTNKSQAPEDGCINIRNLWSIK